MTYTNENKNVQNTISKEISIESQYGLMLYNKLSGYNENETVETITSDPVTVKLPVDGKNKNAILKTLLINNYQNDIENVTIIGNLPTADETNTLSTWLNNIDVDNENAKVYYSSRKTENITDESWTENNEMAVSYKIVINSIKPGEILTIISNIQMPSNITYNQIGTINTKVSYTESQSEKTSTSKIQLETEKKNQAGGDTENPGENPGGTEETPSKKDLDIQMLAKIGDRKIDNESQVREGETIKYTIKVTNNTGKDYKNLKIKATQKNGYTWDYVEKKVQWHTDANNYTETTAKYYEVTNKNEINIATIDNLSAGSSYEFSYKTSTKNVLSCSFPSSLTRL